MSAKIGRYIVRMIRGRLTPIRIGAEKATKAALKSGKPATSSKALKKVNFKEDIKTIISYLKNKRNK